MWLVPGTVPGLRITEPFDGLGLRGNYSSPVIAEGVVVDKAAMLKVLEIKAAASDTSLEVTDLAMRVCGGQLTVKRSALNVICNARAATVMAPTSDLLFDFIGKAMCDMPLFD